MDKHGHDSRLLKTYRQKRDFSKTSEPSGEEVSASTGHAFVVQKHAASHLHYDFRLEMDGVLKSWAVAKGPSVDPAVKRLAVEVEDHPLAYGRFEGVIPKGQYGGGTVMLWDRGTWHAVGDADKDYKAGRLKFRLNGNKMKGLWALVRMKSKPRDRHANWLLIKDKDPEAAPGNPDKLLKQDKSVKSGAGMDAIAAGGNVWNSSGADEKGRTVSVLPSARTRAKRKNRIVARRPERMPALIEPQLTTRVDKPPAGNDWLHEIKFDGYRLHARVENGNVNILTRHGEDWTHKFGALAAALKKLPVESCYVDGEAVILNEGGLSDFSALQNWFKTPGKNELVFFAFDLLFFDGEDLRQLPLTSRKKLLQDLIEQEPEPGAIRYSDHQLGHGAAFFDASASLKVEGIVSKSADAPYASGRGRTWLKIKRIERQEFVIGGYTMTSTGHDAIGALLLGEYRSDKLIYVGKVGTGFSSADAKALFKRLSRDGQKTSSFEKVPTEARRGAHWTAPKLVAEIEFGAWTSDHILRHSAFLGLREDKKPEEVKTERVLRVKDAASKAARKDSVPKAAKKTPRRTLSANSTGAEVLGIKITHPDRLIYPKEKIRKLDVAEYYAAISKVMLPHVAERPLSLVRCPDGVGPACFFQKHAGAGLPEDIHQHHIGNGKADEVLTVDSAKGLVSLVQRGVLEVHVWGSHLAHVERPDLVVIDFDPDPSVAWKKVVAAGQGLHDMLEDLGLTSFVKTTGGKGLHVVVPVKPVLEWDGIKQFSKAMAARFAGLDPETFLINMSKKARSGRIFIDYLRNGRGATAVAPYSTRARPGAPVATPVSWKELKDGAAPLDFTLATVPKRIGRGFNDPWKGIHSVKQHITVKMIELLTRKG